MTEQMSPLSTELPAPTQQRWQPLRLGVIDMFYYDVEEFHFRDGRLLLRGNNGTGKSKVLALTLPFLLDGEMSAHRVEPDGDPKKRMEWNLLLGEEHPHPERLGYTWLELGRQTEDGGTEFRTLGCGMKAVRGRGIARHWYFVTSQRIGLSGPEQLQLLDATRTALSRDRLEEALGGAGLIYDTARSYRRAVDEQLFGLGEQRYGALVDLLVQLRQPQLSKRPSEAALSRALTEALPPIGQGVVADVADAFRSLDEDRAELDSMVDAGQAASTFLEHYRRYARIAARRRARAPRERNSEYESLRSDLTEQETEYQAAQEVFEAAETELERQENRSARLAAEQEALQAGPEMRSAEELNRAAEEARRAAQRATDAGADRDHAAGEHHRAEQRRTDAEQRQESAATAVESTLTTAAERAAAAGIEAEHNRVVTETGQPADVTDPNALHSALEGEASRRERAVGHVEQLADEAGTAEEGRRRAEERLADAEATLHQAAERTSQAGDALATAAQQHLDGVRNHLAGCTELRLEDLEGMLDGLQDWTTHLTGPSPARAAAETAARTAGAELAAHTAEMTVQRETLDRARTQLDTELERLRAGGQQAPPAPHTRGPEARQHRPGAPLWKLVDFTEVVTESERAGVEAALEAGGLLDAWIAPDGTVVEAETHDVLLTAESSVAGASLGEVLSPAADQGDPQAATVAADTVAGVLAAVGLGADSVASTWVAADGRFRIGVLAGQWAKEQAEYVGEGAREAARRARITAVEAELGDLAEQDRALRDSAAAVTARQQTLDGELAAFPTEEALRSAQATVAEATREHSRAHREHEQRVSTATEAERIAQQARENLTQAATELRVPTGTEALRKLRAALVDYRLSLANLAPALRELRAAQQTVLTEQEAAQRWRAYHEDRAERAEAASREAAAAEERHTTLDATVGTAVAELQRQLAENRSAYEECRRAQGQARQDQQAAVERRGRAHGRLEQLRTDIETAQTARATAMEALRKFTATGLLAVALPELSTPPVEREWSARPAVDLARAIEAELGEVDDADRAWERAQKRLSEELTTLRDVLSRHAHSASAQSLEEGVVVRVMFQGRERSVPELADALTAEIEERQRMLSAREREILENHLITEVAGTLQELIGQAERQVEQMNAELKGRPTSTGMRLRLVWRPSRSNAPAGLEAARERLLRQDSDAWSPEDREAIGTFLQAHIERVRAADQSGGTWMEHLSTALDYRSWHEFGVERHQHGQWRSATGPASGGERVLSMSIPLFAAASSHYASAGNPHAPRLIALDEAFAGVDDEARANCLGLLRSFDLDVVMTSEREWGCYPEVPGLAISHLSRVDGVSAVLVTRWEWDGRQRTRAADPPAGLPETRETTQGDDASVYEGQGTQNTLWS